MVFIRLPGEGLKGRMGQPGPGTAAGFGDLSELGARSGRPRRVCGQSRGQRRWWAVGFPGPPRLPPCVGVSTEGERVC